MDVVLLTLTTLSLAAAAGFAVMSWRIGREEQERSRARVTALATSLGPARPAEAINPGHATGRVAVGSVFDRNEQGIAGRPALKFAVVGVMALAIVIGAIIGSRTTSAPPPQAVSTAPLELVSMRYVREGGTLTVTGLVRNPANGVRENGISAVVFAFDHAGGFVSSGRAPLDVGAFAPGDESPFIVAVPNVTDVARYRVSFRNERGVVRHVDRRSDQIRLAQAVR